MSESDIPVPLLSVQGIVKRFPGVTALDHVDLEIQPGEVLAVVGENGAGKSSLMKILAGVEQPDAGEIRLEGRTSKIGNVRDATRLGIALIHQELNLADNLDVGANVWLGREPRWLGLINKQRIHEDTRPILQRLGAECESTDSVSSLSIGKRQLVEIAKALSVGARILIMDEPTSSLTLTESRRLSSVIGDLRDEGVSIVYISHRLGEVTQLADRVVVLRDGRVAGELHRKQINSDSMVRLMVGRELSSFYPPKRGCSGHRLLTVDKLRTEAFPGYPISFDLRSGEITGLAGLIGSGRTELVETILGIRKPVSGSISIAGNVMPRHQKPADAIRAGLALTPEDRKRQGLFLSDSVKRNISINHLATDSFAGLVNHRAEQRLARRMMDDLGVRSVDEAQPVRLLSGGNQQKVVLARWLANQPKVILLDEPTRGIDIGARQQIYQQMDQLASEGAAILFVSSELDELIGMADRVLVFHAGACSGELIGHSISEHAIMSLATDAGAASKRFLDE